MTDTTNNDEPTTPTREQIADAVYGSGGLCVDQDEDDVAKIIDAVLALFSQPSPSTATVTTDRLFEWDDRKRLLEWWHDGRREAEDEVVLSEFDLTYAGLMRVAEQVEASTREVLSQPSPSTPSTEEEAMQVQFENMYPDSPTPEPVRIEDMAPGTELTVDYRRQPRRVRVLETGSVWLRGIDDEGPSVRVEDIDPSTVRDVTPPPALPEDGR